MIKLNDDNLIVGQIKQTLHNFNLPRCYINDKIIQDYWFNNKHWVYKLSHYLVNGGYIIDNNNLYRVDKNKETQDGFATLVDSYIENNKYLNLTTILDINSKYYDDYTHKYLGEYLRFVRDYYGINLMSMYNCNYYHTINNNLTFGKSHDIINYTPQQGSTWKEYDEETINIDDYDVYICPAKINKDYTISLIGEAEVAYCFYDIEQDTQLKPFIFESSTEKGWGYNYLYHSTKRNFYCNNINSPYLLSKDVFPKDMKEINGRNVSFDSTFDAAYTAYNNEKVLCLIVKVAKGYEGPLVILEGDYTNNGQIQINLNVSEDVDITDDNYWKNLDLTKYITNPQLLSYENNDKYLLADKLIEYLTENAITNISESYDIEKLQKWLNYNKDNLKEKYGINVTQANTFKGIWSKELTYSLIQIYYYYLNTPKYNNKTWYDFIGYVDSNMEDLFEKLGIEKEYEYGGIV